MVRVRDPNRPYFSSKWDLYKSFKIDLDTQMYLRSSALIFYVGREIPLESYSFGYHMRIFSGPVYRSLQTYHLGSL